MLSVTMPVTGLVLALFVVMHLVGNLKAFLGPEHLDEYALWLRTAFAPLLPHEALLWILRVGLLVCVAAHVASAVVLAGRSRRSRGVPRRATGWRSLPGRAMLASGVVVGLFVVLRLLDLTTGTAPVAADGFRERRRCCTPRRPRRRR